MHSSAIQQSSTVFLKTAIAPIWSQSQCADVNILFDEGAQQSFIAQALSDKLKVRPDGKKTSNISAFKTTSCSPFILNATLLKHFEENPSPTASRITQDLYVDNVLTSFTAEDDLMQFYRDSRCLLQKGGFNLRSWNSNSNRLRELAETENVLDSSNEVNILGMRWNVADDKLLFAEVDIDSTMVDVTKREILRQSSKIFDPLGILSPVTVKAKILMQSLWKRNFGWDERLPEDVTTQWTTYLQILKIQNKLKFRDYLTTMEYHHNQLDYTFLPMLANKLMEHAPSLYKENIRN
ncbi:unnamed protein product [Mytilus edulis]|uniref:Peptidase aspartic putative domain-containing protein n=1 Tax=Mytilus edulis TaxID=6550 RepID=A0A8S3SF02_MYTED|nr:unnamed protein product [Mytilus edulis]